MVESNKLHQLYATCHALVPLWLIAKKNNETPLDTKGVGAKP